MGERLNVLQIVEANTGGVRLVLRDLVRALVAAGHDVTVAYSPCRGPESEQGAADCRLAGARVIPVSMKRAVEPWSDLRALGALVSLLRRQQFDIVHCHSSKAGLLGRVASRVAGVRLCYYSPHCYAFNGARHPLAKWCLRRAESLLIPWTSVLIAVSRYEAEQAVALGTPSDRVAVVPNGTAIPPARPPGQTAGPLRIGGAGHLVRQKGFDILIHSLVAIQKRYPDLHVELAGDGPMRHDLVRLAKRSGISLTLLGRLPHLREWLYTIDLLVQPSRWEGLPLVVLEAMSCGVPVVATAVGGVPEVIEDGITGLLVPPEDTGALSQRLESALASPERLREVAARARLRIMERFSLDLMLDGYRRLYAGVTTSFSHGDPPPDGTRARRGSEGVG